MKPASEGCVQTMRTFLLGPVQKRIAVFQKKKKKTAKESLTLGWVVVLIALTSDPRAKVLTAVSKQGTRRGKEP